MELNSFLQVRKLIVRTDVSVVVQIYNLKFYAFRFKAPPNFIGTMQTLLYLFFGQPIQSSTSKVHSQNIFCVPVEEYGLELRLNAS